MCISNIEDLITFIVNNQILTRRWRVIYDKNYLVSNNYPFPHHVSYLRLSKFSNYLDKFSDVFRKLRMDFIDNKIMRVLEHTPHCRTDWTKRYHRGRCEGKEKERRRSISYISDTNRLIQLR